MAVLGIDFGTSYTFIVEIDNNERTPYGGMKFYEGNFTKEKFLKSTPGIKTKIGWNGDSWKVGSEADDIDGNNVCVDLKTKIRQMTKYMIGSVGHKQLTPEEYTDEWYQKADESDKKQGRDCGKTFLMGGRETYYSAVELAKIFFEEILKDDYGGTLKGIFDDIDCIVCGVPGIAMEQHETDEESSITDSLTYKSILTEYILKPIIEKTGKDNIKCIPIEEPVLAAVAFYDGKLNYGQNTTILVVDCGGGTTDYALIKCDTNALFNFRLVNCSEGSSEPAGNTFDEMIAETLGKDGRDFKEEALTDAKEQLFRSFDRFASEHPELETAALNEGYRNYIAHGRRASVSDNNGNHYVIALNSLHKNDVTENGYYATTFRGPQEGEGAMHNLVEKINDFALSNLGKISSVNRVLFVGGSSNMDIFRDYVMDGLFGTQGDDGCWRSDGSVIKDDFFQIKDSNPINCSNAIAIGAALSANKALNSSESGESRGGRIIEIMSIPKVNIIMRDNEEKTNEELCILTKKFKMDGEDENVIDDTYPGLSYWLTEIKNSSEKSYAEVEFQILVETNCGKKYYPGGYNKQSNRWYRFRTPAISFEDRMDVPQEYKYNNIAVRFLADINANNGELAVFCCVMQQATPKMTSIESYVFKTSKGDIIISCLDGVRAASRVQRKYSVHLMTAEHDDDNIGSDKSKRNSSKYSVLKNIGDGFGWTIKRKK